MNPDQSPSEISPFERRLQTLHAIETSTALQFRIMQAVGRELSRSPVPAHRNGDFLSFAAAMAAVLLIGLNLARMAACVTPFDARPRMIRQETLADAAALQQLSLDLTKADAMRIALLYQSGANVMALPELKTSGSLGRDPAVAQSFERTVQ